MNYILTLLFVLLLVGDTIAQTRSTRSRSDGATSTGTSTGSSTERFRDGQEFTSIARCESSGCPCCIFMRYDSVFSARHPEGIRIQKTVCQTDHSGMDDVEALWGVSEAVNINGTEFRLYNADASQSALFQEVFSVIPSFYLEAAPPTIRVGNPSNGSIQTSTSASIQTESNGRGGTREVLKGETYDETIGGGSRRCHSANDPYEYIILHPLTFTHERENPRLTILHELGHFVDRQYHISNRALRNYRSQFASYLRRYRGDSRGNDEVISQGIMYYFLRKYWPAEGSAPAEVTPSGNDESNFPPWLLSIIQADIDSRS